jgi:hypothetical protein
MSKFLLAIACIAAAIFSPTVAHAEPGPLMAGVLSGDLAAVRAALDAGAQPNAVDPELNRLPLHAAVAPGGPRDPDIANLLVTRGARIEAEDSQTGLTPLMTAMVTVERGPFASVERALASALVERLVKLGASPNQAPRNGDTPLMLAVATDNLEMVRTLLSLGANPNLRNTRQATALHAAYALGRRPEMIAALLGAGADQNLRDAQGMTPQQVRPGAQTPVPIAAAPVAPSVPAPAAPPQPAPIVAQPQPPAPAPEQPAPPAQAGNSGISNWLIGGAMVAATVVGAVLLANHARDQKKKRDSPPPAPAPAQGFDGVYSSTRVLPDGFTHAERSVVSGLNVSTRHTFSNGVAGGSFEWTGTITRTSDNAGTISGSGTINNRGARALTLNAGSNISRAPNGVVTINWNASDPAAGPIGWTTVRETPGSTPVVLPPIPPEPPIAKPAPQPPTPLEIVALGVIRLAIEPSQPAAGEPFTVRATLRNSSARQLDSAWWQLENGNGNAIFRVPVLRVGPKQEIAVQSQNFVRNREQMVFRLVTSPGQGSPAFDGRTSTSTLTLGEIVRTIPIRQGPVDRMGPVPTQEPITPSGPVSHPAPAPR